MSCNRRKLVGCCLALIACFGALLVDVHDAEARPYQLNPKAKNRVEFHSKATMESFSGKAKHFEAEFDIDLEKLSTTKGKVTVDLRTLDTGLELRNKHMRDNHLQTDSFPNAVFQLDSLHESGSDSVMVHGVMTIHGTSQTVSARGVVRTLPGPAMGLLRIESEFLLKITDFGIQRPEFLFLKLAEEVKIIVDLTLEPSTQ